MLARSGHWNVAYFVRTFGVVKPPQPERKEAARSPWTKLWIVSAIAIWTFDGWVIFQSMPWPRSNESVGRAEICQWEEERIMNSHPLERLPGESAYQRCMTRPGEFASIAARRQQAVDQYRSLVVRWVALIAATPFGVAGLFIGMQRVGRAVLSRVRRVWRARAVRRQTRRPSFRS
jgi:hypothetical protein